MVWSFEVSLKLFPCCHCLRRHHLVLWRLNRDFNRFFSTSPNFNIEFLYFSANDDFFLDFLWGNSENKSRWLSKKRQNDQQIDLKAQFKSKINQLKKKLASLCRTFCRTGLGLYPQGFETNKFGFVFVTRFTFFSENSNLWFESFF